VPPSLFPDIFDDSGIPDFPCVNPSMDACTSDHSQNTADVSPLVDSGEDKSFIENSIDFSSSFSGNVEGEHSFFSSTPLYDSSNHEDRDKHPKFPDHGCHDLYTSSFVHDVDSLIVNMSKPPVYDYLSIDEVETSQAIKALQPELMVMLGPHCPGVSSTSDQKIFETPKAPHHSSLCTEDQSNIRISLPPLKSHDPMAYALEESFTTSTLARCKLSLFLMFACLSQSRECICLSSLRSVSQHYGKSIACLSCAFTLFFSMDALKLRVCWSSLLYLSCFLVWLTMLFINHAFTNMGQPMHRWLHWK